MAKVNAFDAIAKKESKPTKAKTSKIAATTTDEMKTAVDTFITHKAEIKRLEAEQAQAYDIIVGPVRNQQIEQARNGNFSKSFLVKGKTGETTYTTSDKFSVPKDQASQDALRELLGEEKFDAWFESKRTITLKPEVQQNNTFITKLAAACKAAGMELGDAFDVYDTVIAKDDLDRKQFELDAETFAQFSTIVKQNKPALK